MMVTLISFIFCYELVLVNCSHPLSHTFDVVVQFKHYISLQHSCRIGDIILLIVLSALCDIYLCQVNEVNGGDNVFVRCVSVCLSVCVHSGLVGVKW